MEKVPIDWCLFENGCTFAQTAQKRDSCAVFAVKETCQGMTIYLRCILHTANFLAALVRRYAHKHLG